METLWAIFTRNGMYSDIEAIIMLCVSVIVALFIMTHLPK